MPVLAAIIAATFGLTGASQAQPPIPGEEIRDWSELAVTDIQAMHELTMRHHPGPHNSLDPDFNQRAETALSVALAYARQAESQAGASYAIRAYAAAYRDGHYDVHAPTGATTVEWPGLIPIRTNGIWRVHAFSPATAELAGAELLSCDGRSPDELMTTNIFEFTGNPALGSQWRSLSPYIFLASSNPFIALPDTCSFSGPSGTVEHVLEWTSVSLGDWNARATPLRQSEGTEFGLTTLGNAEFWISLPTFNPDSSGAEGTSEVDQLNHLISEIETRADELRDSRYIVIDVRGNRGGASSWGNRIVRALWGVDYAAYREPPVADGVDFRVSADNIAHVEWIIDQTIQHDMSEAEDYFRGVHAGMTQALQQGSPLYQEVRQRAPRSQSAANPVNAQVFFLTDGSCGSACLDFADSMYALNGVTHIGAETYADSNYMEFRMTDLPSGLNRLGLPIKVYRGRVRASGETYTPAISYQGEDWSTAALQAWVATLGETAE